MTDPAGPWKQSPFYDTIGEGRSTLRQWASSTTASATIGGKPVAPRSV